MNLTGPWRLPITLVAAGLGAGCAPDVSAPPNLVLVLIDTLRADHTSLHGYERDTTPHLKRIAREGVWFQRHLANAPWTKPSVASILTGLPPTAHGSRLGNFSKSQANEGPWIEVLSDRHETFVERLQEAGYRTGAFVSNQNMAEAWGYAQGYTEYRFLRSEPGAGFTGIDQEVVDLTAEFVEAEEGPTFAWAHLMSVHQYQALEEHYLYRPEGHTPVPAKGRSVAHLKRWDSVEMAVAAYDASIHYTDQLVGELYDRLRSRDPGCWFLVTSDHGEEFGEHGGFNHAETLYNEMLEVPLVLAGPGAPAGARATGLTDSLDLYPTLLGLAGVPLGEFPPGGQNLLLGGEVSNGKPASFAEQHFRGQKVRFALRLDDSKWIETYEKQAGRGGLNHVGDFEAVEAFRNRSGPETLRERFTPPESDAQAIRERLLQRRSEALETYNRRIGGAAVESVSEDGLSQLKALGYVDED